MATLLTLSLVAVGASFGVGVAGANHPDDAPDLTEYADFRVNLPHTTDHYPGDKNEENGSIEYFAAGSDAFAEQDAEEGVYMDWIIVHAEYEGEDWIDYSACDTDNTEAFGIDRGNDNEGTQYDEDLVSRQKTNEFRDDGIVINFYEFEDFGGDPPYMAPEDAIVAAQGAGSAAGPCLTLTDEPGWYRIAAFMNATVADNGPDEQPSEDADRVSLELHSNYLYVCECDSEEEAREQLGAPPNEQDDETQDESTPTPTATPEDEPQDEPTPTPTETPDDEVEDETTPTPTEVDDVDDEDGDDGGDETSDGDDGVDQQDDETQDGGDEVLTPTPGDGPGFGPLAAMLALLTVALAVRRR